MKDMNKTKKSDELTKHDFIVQVPDDLSVGVMGEIVPVSVTIPTKDWNRFDKEEQAERIGHLMETIRNVIDPDGRCITKEQYKAELTECS